MGSSTTAAPRPSTKTAAPPSASTAVGSVLAGLSSTGPSSTAKSSSVAATTATTVEPLESPVPGSSDMDRESAGTQWTIGDTYTLIAVMKEKYDELDSCNSNAEKKQVFMDMITGFNSASRTNRSETAVRSKWKDLKSKYASVVDCVQGQTGVGGDPGAEQWQFFRTDSTFRPPTIIRTKRLFSEGECPRRRQRQQQQAQAQADVLDESSPKSIGGNGNDFECVQRLAGRTK
ncbi:unnamed protein product [Absidia cylindrospora]